MFVLGVAGFGVTSLLCALAPTIELLVVARALQGVCGAILTPAALAVIVAVFPPDERGRAVGAWTAWGGIGTVLGPLIGGQLVDSASWRWIFAINLPVVLLTLFIVFRAVPEGRERDPNARVDVVGATLCALGLAGMTFGLIEQPLRGWDDPAVFLSLAIGAGLFASFIVWEARTDHPMLPLGLFRRRNFAIGNIETFSMYGGLGLLFFFLVLFLQQVAGYNALEAGAASIPVTLVMFAFSTRFGMMADRYGPRFFMGVGPLISALGLAWFLRLDADVDYVTDLLPGLLVFALGLSITVAPLTATVLGRRGREQRGNRLGRQQRDRTCGEPRGDRRRRGGRGRLVRIEARGGARSACGAQPAARGRRRGRQAPAARRGGRYRGCRRRRSAEVSEAAEDASISAFRVGIGISTVLVALGGVLGLIGIVNPRRRVEAEDCPGGQLVGMTREGARQSPCDWDAGEIQAAASGPS